MNPYGLTLGQFTTNIVAGNEQGVYYTFTATSTGTLTIDLLSVTAGVNANVTLYNERSYQQNIMSESDNATSVSINVRKGDVVQIIISSIPDDEFKYPAATVVCDAKIA